MTTHDLLTPGERALANEIDASMTAAAMLSAVLRPETMFSPPPTTETLAELTKALQDHYAGGDDGPIREPGDTQPKRGDVYTTAELASMLTVHSAQLARLGYYHIATDIDAASAELTCLEDDVARLTKTIRQLAAEKEVARNWIENLRQTNELYGRAIAEQNARLESLGAGHAAVVDAAQLEAIK